MKKKFVFGITLLLIFLLGYWLTTTVPQMRGANNQDKKINKFRENSAIVIDKNELNLNKDSTIFKNSKQINFYEDSSFNLDSLAKVWIEDELGMDKSDLIEITKETRKKFRKTNSKKDWEKIVERDLWETLEGGIATYYFSRDTVEKIHVRNFGETFQYVQEFYLDKNGVYFVFEIEYKYNRPFYYDSNYMKEGKDNQVFDFVESTITETRSYFKKGKLIRQISNQDCGAPNSQELRDEEQKRLLIWYSLLIETLTEK